MSAPQRYLFDVSFDGPGPLPGSEPRFTSAELEAAREAGFEAGHAAALAAAAAASEERIAAALETMSAGIRAFAEAHAALALEAEAKAVALLRAILRKAVPALCRKDPLAEFEALVADCLGELLDEPRLVLRVGDALFEPMQSRIAGLAAAAGYGGKIILLADATLAPGDGRIEWADGGVERDTRRLADDLDAMLDRALAAAAPRTPDKEKTDG